MSRKGFSMKKKVFLIIIPLLIVIITGCVAVSFNIDKSVIVTIDSFDMDKSDSKENYVPYDTDGKKVITGCYTVRNLSLHKMDVAGLENDEFISVLWNDSQDPLANLSLFDKQTYWYRFLVDEDMTVDEIKEQLKLSTLKTMTYQQSDGMDAEYTYLTVDKVK